MGSEWSRNKSRLIILVVARPNECRPDSPLSICFSTLPCIPYIHHPTMSLLRTQIRRTALSFRAPVPAFARSAHTSVPEPANPLKKYQPDESTPKAQQQSPNVPTTWSTSQNPKPHAQNNARYEIFSSEERGRGGRHSESESYSGDEDR